jgi:hypothetical protein
MTSLTSSFTIKNGWQISKARKSLIVLINYGQNDDMIGKKRKRVVGNITWPRRGGSKDGSSVSMTRTCCWFRDLPAAGFSTICTQHSAQWQCMWCGRHPPSSWSCPYLTRPNISTLGLANFALFYYLLDSEGPLCQQIVEFCHTLLHAFSIACLEI